MALNNLRFPAELTVWSLIAWVVFRKAQYYFFPTGPALSRYRQKSRTYAIVTGASAGIGYGFAQELIAHGFGVILVASRQERLKAAAQKLRSESPDAVIKTLVYNAQDTDGANLVAALKPIQDLPINILVNNVGAITLDPPFQALTDFAHENVLNTINTNTTFMAQLTRIMIPTLERNGPAVVINMSSLAQAGAPWSVVYGATKGFVTSFSVALAREFNAVGSNIHSLAIVPGEVYSEFNSYKLPPGTPTSRQYAKAVLDRVEMAIDRKMWETTPFWVHALQQTIFGLVPEFVKQKLLTESMSNQRVIRTKKE